MGVVTVGAKLRGGLARNLPLTATDSAQPPRCNRGDSRVSLSDWLGSLGLQSPPPCSQPLPSRAVPWPDGATPMQRNTHFLPYASSPESQRDYSHASLGNPPLPYPPPGSLHSLVRCPPTSPRRRLHLSVRSLNHGSQKAKMATMPAQPRSLAHHECRGHPQHCPSTSAAGSPPSQADPITSPQLRLAAPMLLLRQQTDVSLRSR